MAYTPTIWNENDIITAEKLNNIENGISDLVLDLGEVELTIEEGNLKGGVIYFNEEQIQKLSNENLIGVLATLKYDNTTFKTFLNKISTNSSIAYFSSNINSGQVGGLSVVLICSFSQQIAEIYYEVSNSSPVIAAFDSEEEIDGTTGQSMVSLTDLNSISIRLPASYSGPGSVVYSYYFLHKVKRDNEYNIGTVVVFENSFTYQEDNNTYLKVISCETSASGNYTMSYKTYLLTPSSIT